MTEDSDRAADIATSRVSDDELAQLGAYLTLRAQAYVLNEVWHGKFDFTELREKALENAQHANTLSMGRWPHVEIENIPLAAVLGQQSSSDNGSTQEPSAPQAPQEPHAPSAPERDPETPETDTATPNATPDAWPHVTQQQHDDVGREQEMVAAV